MVIDFASRSKELVEEDVRWTGKGGFIRLKVDSQSRDQFAKVK